MLLEILVTSKSGSICHRLWHWPASLCKYRVSHFNLILYYCHFLIHIKDILFEENCRLKFNEFGLTSKYSMNIFWFWIQFIADTQIKSQLFLLFLIRICSVYLNLEGKELFKSISSETPCKRLPWMYSLINLQVYAG